ncbi:CBN-CLEC-135 protein [Caenorhabditis brenneri]|uniref:CBN-CLEC-135 protein n=1 Tax=Caenorhabditis brenneri TaxID=135651 RepID=G0MNB4_CAEBE|nr:CBN-CLEC-135 protein [Caenorhabditis brenneri]
MKRWIALAALAFCVVNVRAFMIENDESCESEEKEKEKMKCPKHYKGYYRSPTANNNQTKMWCLRVVMVNVSVSENAAQQACNAEGSVLSTFASYDEQKYIVRHASKYFRRNNITQGSIWLDGVRIEECRTLNVTKQTAAPCNDKAKVFDITDPRTDPKYAWTQWYRTAPSWAYWPMRTEEFSTYCDMAVPPYDFEKALFTNYGYVCGRPPVLSFY